MRFIRVFAIAAFIVISAGLVIMAENNSFTFIIPVQQGFAETGFIKVLDNITVTISELTGLGLKAIKPSYDVGQNSTEFVMKAFKDNTAQMGYVKGIEYAEYLEKNQKSDIFHPEFMITMDKKKYSEMCMYVAGGGIDSIAKTRGLRWGGSEVAPTRFFLFENGINEPLTGFFKSLKFVESPPAKNLIDALAAGDIDVFVSMKAYVKMAGKGTAPGSGGNLPKRIPYKEIGCTEYESNWIFGYRKDVPQEISNKITNIMVGARKNKAFDKYKFLFMAIDGAFVPFDMNTDFARTRKIAKLITANGWDDENQAFLKKYKPAK
jgi:ABC-type phosphate/phosphonate transport system substrate-binding protein